MPTGPAESNLRSRYPAVTGALCAGVLIAGYESRSSFVHGLTHYWDKLFCVGHTIGGSVFSLIYDRKGRDSWIIYRLHGVSVDSLRG